VKKYLLPLGAGVVVFGVATAFAASLTVNSKSLGAGNDAVTSCNSSANVTYSTAPITAAGLTKGQYKVTGGTLTTVAGVGLADSTCGGMSYRVQLLDSSNDVLGTEATGSLGATTGSATLDFGSSEVRAEDVANVSVVVTG
jgi:hypothetical protein